MLFQGLPTPDCNALSVLRVSKLSPKIVIQALAFLTNIDHKPTKSPALLVESAWRLALYSFVPSEESERKPGLWHIWVQENWVVADHNIVLPRMFTWSCSS